MGEVSL